MGELKILSQGGDPSKEMTPAQAGTDPKAQLRYIAGQQAKKYQELRGAADTAGWGILHGHMKDVMAQYTSQNQAPLQKLHEFSSPEDQFRLQMQLRPIEVDPNLRAEMHQLSVQIDQAIKAVDPDQSFWTHPDFKDVADWLNREAGEGQTGFMTSGPQEMGMAADISEAGLAGAEAGVDMGLGMLYTAWSWGADGLNAMGVEAPQPPTNYVIDPKTGELIPDTARPNPGLIETIVALRNHGNQKAYFEEITALKGARHMQQLQAGAGAQVLRGAAQIVGMMGLPPIGKLKGMAGGFAPAVAAMRVGTGLGQRLVHKGLVRLGASTTKRSAKIMTAIGGVVGAATGNAGAMALAYGRHDDYSTQAMHGAAIAPILIVLGALGKGAERMLKTRPNIPSGVRKKLQDSLAAAFGGGVEGYGFGVMDDIQTRGLWEFLKDPTPASWATYLGNMAGMAMLKGAGAAGRPEQRRAQDEKKVRGEAEKAVTAEAEDLSPEAKRIGEAERGRRPLAESRKDVEKVIEEHAGPTGKQRREIQEALEPEGPFGVPESYRYQAKPFERAPTAEEAEIKKVLGAFVKDLGVAPVGKPSPKGAEAAAEAPPEAVRRGETRGVGSFQAGPERQVGAVEGVKEITLGELKEVMGGRRGRAGLPTPFGRLGGKKGDPVQVEFRVGKTKGAEGLSKKLGVTRSKIENDIVVETHEWSHESMQVISRRRMRSGFSRQEAFEQEAIEFIDSTKSGFAEAERMLVGEDAERPLYPGADKWFQAVRMEVDAEGKPLSDMDPNFALYKIGSEAWAEIGARKLLGDAVRLEAEAPNLTVTHESTIVAEVGLFEQFHRMGDALSRWRDQGAAKRSEMSASQTDKRLTKHRLARQGGSLAVKARSVKKIGWDDLAEARAERERGEIASGEKVGSTPLSADPARQIDRMVATSVSEAETFIERHTMDASGNPTGISLRTVFSEVAKEVKLTEFQNYLNSVRGLEDYKKGLDTTLAKSDYIATLRTLQEKAPVLKQLGKVLKAYSGRVVDYLVDQGGMSPADAAKFKDGRHMHVTLLRAIMEQGGKSGTSSGTAPRGAKGGGGELFNLAEAMVKMTHHYVRLGQKARVYQSVLEAAKRGLGHVAEVIPKGAEPSNVDVKAALKELYEKAAAEGNLEAMEALELLDQAGLKAETLTLFTGKKWPGAGDKFTVPVLDRGTGKTVWVRVGEKTFAAIQGDHVVAIPQNALAKATRGLSTVFRKSGVEYNPQFALGAAIRDMMFRPSVTRGGFAKKLRYGLGPVGHAMDLIVGGAKMAAGKVGLQGEGAQFARRMRDTGMFTSGNINAQAEVGRIRNEFRQNRGAISKMLKGLHEAASVATTWTEHAPRLQAAQDVYKQALKRGLSDRDAVAEAQEAYREEMINFAKGGTMARAVGGYVPFLKASLLGHQKAFQAMGTKEGVAAAFANVTVPAIISFLLYEDEAWFQDLEDWERTGYLHVSKDVRLPIPYELGQVFGTAPQLAILEWRDHPDYDPDADQWLGLAAEVMIPFLNDMRFTPPIFKALVEVKTGFDLFRNKPIVPAWLKESRTPERQVRLDTGEVAKGVFKHTPQFMLDILNVDNPAEMGHLGKALVPGIAPHLVEALESAGPLGMMEEFVRVDKRITVPRGHMSKANRLMGERITDLTQRKNAKELEVGERSELARLLRAKRRVSKLWAANRDGRLTDEDLSDQIREIAMQALAKERR